MSQADKMTAEEVWPTLPHPTSFPMVLRGLGGRGAWPGDVPGPPEAAAWGGQGAAPRLTPPTSKNHTGAGWSSVPVIRWPPRPFPSSLGLTPTPTGPQVDQMFQFATIDAAGNLDYKALSYVLTHGEEKEE